MAAESGQSKLPVDRSDGVETPTESSQPLLSHTDPRDVARLLASAADVAILVEPRGTIREVFTGVTSQNWQRHIGQMCKDTVTPESRNKVQSILTECSRVGQSRSREVNQSLEGGLEVPYRFAALRVDAEAIVVVGRDLSTNAAQQQQMLMSQQALEREYARLRQEESRYRTLFRLSSEGVLIVDGSTFKITDANPAAAELFAVDAASLVCTTVFELVEPTTAEAVKAHLSAALGGARSPDMDIRTREGARTLPITVSMLRQAQSSILLLRLDGTQGAIPIDRRKSKQLLHALEVLPDAFVLLDQSMRIVSANLLFCELAQLAHESAAHGQPIERFLGQPGVSTTVIASSLREHGVVRNFGTVVRGVLGQSTEVGVSGVSSTCNEMPCIALVMRPAAARVKAINTGSRSVEQLRELVGSVPLKDIIRESSELVERLCIEAALSITSNNRASAAQLLGLSRQGLYLKLRRHNLED